MIHKIDTVSPSRLPGADRPEDYLEMQAARPR
jgi:hypothetical protein